MFCFPRSLNARAREQIAKVCNKKAGLVNQVLKNIYILIKTTDIQMI